MEDCMSDDSATAAEVLGWIQECISNPDVTLRTTDAMVSADPGAQKGYMVHFSRFLAYGQQALGRSESARTHSDEPSIYARSRWRSIHSHEAQKTPRTSMRRCTSRKSS
jgi:hypothetical protein